MAGDFETLLTHRIWSDPEFAQKAQSSPADALAELGVSVPDGVTINIVVQQPDTLYFAIPPERQADPDSEFRQTQMDIWGSGQEFIWMNSSEQAANMLAIRNSAHGEGKS